MAIPRHILIVAVGAIAAGAVLYVRGKMQAEKERQKKPPQQQKSSESKPESSAEKPAESSSSEPGKSGSSRELSLFLAGESWYDEIGWQGIWEREGIESPEGWLRSVGKDVLIDERKKLAAHPALLAGCRRRWIVVCRYGGVDVSDAASLWNSTEA